jgi:hypothetical protein
VFRAYQLAKNDYSITENKHRLTKPCPPSKRASSSLELPETSMVKNLQRSLQMALKIAPMDPTRPKTPGWAFTAPQSAKN